MKALLFLMLVTPAPAEILAEGVHGIIVAENRPPALVISQAGVPGQPPDVEPIQEYGLAFAREIASDQHFPREALRQGWVGSVEIRVTVGADARLGEVSVAKSSGHTILDDEAVAKVMRARALPQVPAPLAGRAFTLSFPVVFRLE